MLFTSPAISVDATVSLWRRAHCRIFLAPETSTNVCQEALQSRQMCKIPLPAMDEMLHAPVPHFPYEKSFEGACSDLSGIFHSSGSTGFPKLLRCKQALDCAIDSYQLLPYFGERPVNLSLYRGKRVFSCFPLPLNPGFTMTLTLAILYDWMPVLVPAAFRAGAEISHQVHLHGNVQVSLLGRAMVIDIARSQTRMKTLERLDFVSTGGAPIPQAIGDAIAARTRLVISIGMTETGILPVEVLEGGRKDWNYFKFSPALHHEMRELYGTMNHMVIVRDNQNRFGVFQGIFKAHPKMSEFPTGDLYVKHPTKPDWWRHSGRVDDVQIFSGGQAWNPVPTETLLEAHPQVSAALICGHARQHAVLLIEKVGNEEMGRGDIGEIEAAASTYDHNDEQLIEELWPIIECSMRDDSIPETLLTKRSVVFTTADKPMVRTPAKRTVQRQSTISLYRDMIARYSC